MMPHSNALSAFNEVEPRSRPSAVEPQARPLAIVVDDDDEVRQAICELLESVDIEARGFASARELLDAEVLDRPGCMILDVRMPGLSGLDFQSQLAANGLPPSIIFLTGQIGRAHA